MKQYKTPRSFDDLLSLQEDGVAEGPWLEYKSGALFEENNNRVFDTLAKEISAFANSSGGLLIIGITEDKNSRCIESFSPVSDPKKNETWIEDGLLTRITPPLSINIQPIQHESGFIYAIEVPQSFSGPHQSSDKRYYARRMFRVDPLLDYEIDDIRRRKGTQAVSVELDMLPFRGGINFNMRNNGHHPVFNLSFKVIGIDSVEIAKQWFPNLGRPYTEPFKKLEPDEERVFPCAGFDFLKKSLSDVMIVVLEFEDENETKYSTSKSYHLDDLAASHEPRDGKLEAIEEIAKEIKNLTSETRNISQTLAEFKRKALHPSGINLSNTTLTALSGCEDVKWPGWILEFDGIAEILQVNHKLAFKILDELFGSYHYLNKKSRTLESIDLPDDVKERIRKKFILPPTD